MKKNGFTLVELLAVIVIMGILMVLALPALNEVYSKIKQSNRNAKIQEIEKAAEKYGSKIKDEVKNELDKNGNCLLLKNDPFDASESSAAFLIKKGYIGSDVQGDPELIDPISNSPLLDNVYVCYCTETFDIEARYTQSYQPKNLYKGDYVESDRRIYTVAMDYKPNKKYNDQESEKKCPKSHDEDNKYISDYGTKWVEQCSNMPTEESAGSNDIHQIVNSYGESFFIQYQCTSSS